MTETFLLVTGFVVAGFGFRKNKPWLLFGGLALMAVILIKWVYS